MFSKYLKYFFVLLLLILHIQSFGQSNLQNLLDQMPDNDISQTSFWVEKGDYFYFVSRQQAGPVNPVLRSRASQYFINKYDKNTLQRIDQKHFAGDTLQNDSIVSAHHLALKNDQFYLFYRATTTTITSQGDTGLQRYFFYQRLDMDFNALAPKKKIEDSSRFEGVLIDCYKPMDNGYFFIGFWPFDTPGIPRTNYLILDSMGNTVSIGEAGYTGQFLGQMRGFTPLGNHQYLVSGHGFAGLNDADPSPKDFGWCMVDDNMQTLDTFKDKLGVVQDPVSLYYQNYPGTLVLPGGSLITATGTGSLPGALGGDSDYPLIRKHTPATRYSIDKMVISGPIDNTDTAHENNWIPVSVVYNPFENTLYYASVTHMIFYGLSCGYLSEDSYLELISLDTNLNIKWKKYFKMPGLCSRALGLHSPDGRPGAIITGSNTFFENSEYILKDWVYYITDATVSDSIPTGIAEQVHVNNNIKIFPNPANDIIHIVAEKAALKSVTICDITGRILITKSLSKQAESMDISTFGKGLYLLKCVDKEGSIFVKKVMKE